MHARSRCIPVLAAAALVSSLAPCGAAGQPDEPPAAAYRRLLVLLADGQEEEALHGLMALDRRLLETGHDLEQAREERLAVVEALRPFDPKPIPPVIDLHERAYLTYRAEGAVTQARNTTSIMVLLCDLLASRVLTTAERRLAAGWFASLGGYAQETSTGPIAMSLFQRALALEAANEAALLGAATDLERRGRFLKALPHLEQLARVHPENAEGRLRLAINLNRAHRSAEAEVRLRELLEAQAPPWVLSLAHQELARLLLNESRWDRALSVLERGLARHPEDPALAVAVAYTRERLAAGGGDLELLAGPTSSAEPRRRPPRFAYSRPSAELFARLRAALHRDAAATRGVLAAALAEHAPPGHS